MATPPPKGLPPGFLSEAAGPVTSFRPPARRSCRVTPLIDGTKTAIEIERAVLDAESTITGCAVSVFNVLVTFVAGMGAMGLGLAIVGLYGLVAYAASRRTREIGIRMTIGAERATVVRLELRDGVALALGLAIGWSRVWPPAA